MQNDPAQAKWGFRLTALLGLVFIGLGALYLVPHPSSAPPRLMLIVHMFGLRTAFLGALVVVLAALQERRALLVLLGLAMLLPVADMAESLPVLSGDWARAAASTLPFEVPLLVSAGLLNARL